MKKALIISSIAIFLISSAYMISHISGKKLALKCTGDSLNIRLGKDMNGSKLITTNNIFLYENGLGLITQKGELYFMGKRYIIDREASVSYSDLDKDGIYTVTITQGSQRAYDNLPKDLAIPHHILGWYSPSLYMSASQINSGIILFKELNSPTFLCKAS